MSAERFGRFIFAAIRKSVGLKGLSDSKNKLLLLVHRSSSQTTRLGDKDLCVRVAKA